MIIHQKCYILYFRQNNNFDTHHLLTRDNLTKPEFVKFIPEKAVVSQPKVTKSKPTRSMFAINKAETEAPSTKVNVEVRIYLYYRPKNILYTLNLLKAFEANSLDT